MSYPVPSSKAGADRMRKRRDALQLAGQILKEDFHDYVGGAHLEDLAAAINFSIMKWEKVR